MTPYSFFSGCASPEFGAAGISVRSTSSRLPVLGSYRYEPPWPWNSSPCHSGWFLLFSISPSSVVEEHDLNGFVELLKLVVVPARARVLDERAGRIDLMPAHRRRAVARIAGVELLDYLLGLERRRAVRREFVARVPPARVDIHARHGRELEQPVGHARR